MDQETYENLKLFVVFIILGLVIFLINNKDIL